MRHKPAELWTARTEAVAYLEASHADQLAVLSRTFDLIDQSIDAYESLAGGDVYARICGLTLLKAKNLAVGAYSLILDGLGQEAGALIRPFIEYSELLTYFCKFPKMAERAADNDLPKAGERARAIGGIFKEFRDHLNSHASHSSYSHYSLAHLLEPQTHRFKKLQRAVPKVLDKNLKDFVVQLFLLAREGVLSLNRLSSPQYEELAALTDQLKEDMVHVFELHTA